MRITEKSKGVISMKKQLLSAVAAGLLSVSMITSAFAGGASGGGAVPTADGTEVWAGILLDDPDAQISVFVPTLFAFVVNGSVDALQTAPVKSSITLAQQGITGGNETILLPNVKVDVTTDPATATSDYAIQTVGSGNMQFQNMSTRRSTSAETATNGTRTGLGVDIRGAIKNEGTEASRNYWTHVANVDDVSAVGTDTEFKKYTLEVGKVGGAAQKFDAATADGSLAMTLPIALPAPALGYDAVSNTYSNLNTGTNLAVAGAIEDIAFNVHIGGQQGQYNQVEESAKVGTIVWTISALIDNSTTLNPTSPSLPVLPSVTP